MTWDGNKSGAVWSTIRKAEKLVNRLFIVQKKY